MDPATVSALTHALWPLLTLAVVSLWMAAMSEILGHRRAGWYTRAGLSCIAAVVSVVAVATIVGIGAVFAGQRHAAAEGAQRTDGQGDQRQAFLFSFGLEHVHHPAPDGPADDGSVTGTR